MTARADTQDQAHALISETMDERLGAFFRARLVDGTVVLRPDPYVAGVWGIIEDANGKCRAVLYLTEDDFEYDDVWVDGWTPSKK